MKHLRKLLIALLGGIMMTGMLAGCDNSKTVEEELQPMFEMLDKQEVKTETLVSIKEYFEATGQDYENRKGYDVILTKNDSGALEGNYTEINSSESISVVLVDGQGLYQVGEKNVFFKNLFLKDFHFSKEYFKRLTLEETYDSFETYMKEMIYEEILLSDYTKGLQKEYNLSENLNVKIEIHKGSSSERTYNYSLTYYLLDKDNNYSIERKLVVELEKENDE